MGLKIYWTIYSKRELRNIFVYYKETTNTVIANKLVSGIIQAVLKLERQPNIGQKELLLLNRKEEFRYLIYKNYKIIYWFNTKKNQLEITDIFDTRQNPVQITRNK